MNARTANSKGILVVLSGGQDSTTCLHWALARVRAGEFKFPVRAVCFHYGQKHKIEIDCARKFAYDAGVPFEMVHLGDILRSTSPLVSDSQLGKYESVDDLPGGIEPTFVPCRNVLFLTVATNYALSLGIRDIVTGVCQADFGGYPDCRRDTMDALEMALSLAVAPRDSDGAIWQQDSIKIHTPLMILSKKESVELARDLGPACWNALAESHTCYDGTFPPCEKCHACHLRARGFKEAGLNDPLLERAKDSCKVAI